MSENAKNSDPLSQNIWELRQVPIYVIHVILKMYSAMICNQNVFSNDCNGPTLKDPPGYTVCSSLKAGPQLNGGADTCSLLLTLRLTPKKPPQRAIVGRQCHLVRHTGE